MQSIDGPLPGDAYLCTYQYDATGALRAVVHPQHVIERFERDTWGRITAHTGLDGVRETLEYGADGNIERYSRGDTWMRVRYDDAGRISQVLDSLGQALTLTRDDAGELIQLGDAAGNRIRWSYGERGHVRDLVLLNPDGSLSQRGHPDNQRIDARVTDCDASIPNEAMLSAVARALPDEVAAAIPGLHDTPPAGGAAPPLERAMAVHAMPVGVRTVYDAERRATSYVYDDFGRLTAEHSPVSGTTRFRWKIDGKTIDASRSRKELYESAHPQQQRWSTLLFSKTKLTSSQLLQLLFGVGSLQPEHAKYIAFFLGFLNEAMIVVDSAENTPQAADEARTAEFKWLLSATAFAGQTRGCIVA